MDNDVDIPPFIPSDDSDDDLAIEEVQAAITPAHSAPTTTAFAPIPPQTSVPPRKRQRTVDCLEMKPEGAGLVVYDGPPQRDADYYMTDGSCVLLIENTLFNVRSPFAGAMALLMEKVARCTARCYHATHRSSRRSSPSRRATRRRRVPQMIDQSVCTAIPSASSRTFFGCSTPCASVPPHTHARRSQ
jgi:hypothetical protein